jgi:hypothetical protein
LSTALAALAAAELQTQALRRRVFAMIDAVLGEEA